MVAIIPHESVETTTPSRGSRFRWTYIVLPVAIPFISAILAAVFYGRLPSDVAYHFTDGAPDRWLSRGAITAWMVIPQFVLTLFALGITMTATMLVRHLLPGENILVRKALLIMGNMVALPQIILAFAMLYIFLYNSYQVHLMPLWIFALLVMVLGGIIPGFLLVRALRQSRRPPCQGLKES